MIDAQQRYAGKVVGVFAVVACVWAWQIGIVWTQAAPFMLFHAALLVNTYFSINTFSRIVPRTDWHQWVIDVVLAIIYLFLPIGFGHPVYYLFLTIILFLVAILKYALLIGRTAELALLRRKILIDTVGAMWCVVAFFDPFIVWVHESRVAWAWSIGFVIANIYFLAIKPMYRLSTGPKE